MRSRQLTRILLISLLALHFLPAAHAQSWPTKPVKIIAPFAAGGSSDSMARLIAQHLSEAFGQPFVVENRAGAAGAIAADAVVRAEADGHTLFWATANQIAIGPAVSKTNYDPVKDFAPISIIGRNAFVLLVHNNFETKTLGSFVQRIQKAPKALPYGASGVGSATNVLMALFLKRANINLLPVMYRGAAPAMNDLLSGQIKAMFAPVPLALQQISGGSLRLLAVSSKQRVEGMTDVPTFIESGFPGFAAYSWNGVMAPAGTPRPVIDRLAKEVIRAVNNPKIRGLLVSSGIEPVGDTPAEFADVVAADVKLWAEAVQALPAKATPNKRQSR